MTTYARTVSDLLREANWEIVRRGKGSHTVWHSPDGTKKTVVPEHLCDRNFAKRIVRQAGLAASTIR